MEYCCASDLCASVSILVKVTRFGRESFWERFSYMGLICLHGPHLSKSSVPRQARQVRIEAPTSLRRLLCVSG